MESQQARLRRRFTYALLFFVMGFAVCFNVTPILLQDLSSAFHLSPSMEGSMNSIINVGSVLALISMLFFQGRVKKSWLLAASGVVLAVCLALKGGAANYVLLLAIFFLFGIPLGLSDGCCNAFVVELNGAEANRYLGMLHGFSCMGSLLAPLMITAIRDHFPWRSTYFLVAAIVAVPFGYFLYTCFYMKKRLQVSPAADQRLTLGDIRAYLTDRRNLSIQFCLLLFMLFFNGLTVWVTLYTERVLGAPELRAWPLALFWGCSAVSRLLAPRLRIRPRSLFLVLTPLAGLVALLGFLARNPYVLMAACALCGVLAGPGLPTLIGIGCARYQERTGLPSALLVIMQYIGGAVSPMIMAAISSAASLQESMVFAACCAFAAAAAALLIRE